jgi:hypothetical protein
VIKRCKELFKCSNERISRNENYRFGKKDRLSNMQIINQTMTFKNQVERGRHLLVEDETATDETCSILAGMNEGMTFWRERGKREVNSIRKTEILDSFRDSDTIVGDYII